MRAQCRSGGIEYEPYRDKRSNSKHSHSPTYISIANGSSPQAKNRRKPGKMRLFVIYGGERATVDVTDEQTVGDVKQVIRDLFNMGPDPGPGGIGRGQKILALYYMGSDLSDEWIMYDVGIRAGGTIKVQMKDEIRPVLHIHCGYSGETVPILDKLQIPTLYVGDLRRIVSRKTGMPIGVFRLLNKDGSEMYDCHTLYNYQIEHGHTLRMETWDGWNDFLNLAIMGFTSQVFALLSNEELVARYQMKVALYIAAHFGHVDLTVSLLRQGVRADEVVGDHPSRQWCRNGQLHIDALKTPVHVAAEQGQQGVLRSFVHNSVCSVLAKDGNGLTPLNIALRNKQKPCASFLLTKQWSRINYTTQTAIPLNIFVKMKRWSERAKDKVIIIYGQWKSSLKNPKRHVINGALIGHGVILDGFTSSKMTSKGAAMVKMEEEKEGRRKRLLPEIKEDKHDGDMNPEQYFKSVGVLHSLRLPKLNKWNNMLKNVSSDKIQAAADKDHGHSSQGDSETPPPSPEMARRDHHDLGETRGFKLPPIQENRFKVSRVTSSSYHNVVGSKTGSEFGESRRFRGESRASFLLTGGREDGRKSQPKHQTSQQTDLTKKLAPKRKRRPDLTSDVLLAKARTTDGSMALPMVSHDVPRPFVKASEEDITRQTMSHYERYRGIKSRDYAIKCLSVANSFKDKPWLHQVRQAMAIASQGVRKTVSRRPHLFTDESIS